jgi:hypothetical protein
MPSTLSPVDLANIALSKIGNSSINSLQDQTNAAAVACNQNFTLAYLALVRASRWNCLIVTAVLPQIAQTLLTGTGTTVVTAAVPWSPRTLYTANAFLSYGGYYYTVNFQYTSSSNFTNDVTSGYLSQTDQQQGQSVTDAFSSYGAGASYASGWAFQYQLPADFQLLDALNENVGNTWGLGENTEDYEIMGTSLFCNCNQAVIQYVQSTPDTTRFDAMFTDCLTFKLASMIATKLRQDGGAMERELVQATEHLLRQARAKNGGEKQSRRFNPIASSRFIQSRRGGSNG